MEFKDITGLNEGLAIISTQVITILVTVVLVSTLFWFLNKTTYLESDWCFFEIKK